MTALATHLRRAVSATTVLVLGLAAGCVERELVVESNPPGALVYMNDQEVGRTPFKREFEWYGTYDVTIRAEGYETLKQPTPVIAPPWMFVPFDLIVEVLPFRVTDTHRLNFTLKPTTDAEASPQAMFDRANELRGQLQSGEKTSTRPSTTKPAAPKKTPNTRTATPMTLPAATAPVK